MCPAQVVNGGRLGFRCTSLTLAQGHLTAILHPPKPGKTAHCSRSSMQIKAKAAQPNGSHIEFRIAWTDNRTCNRPPFRPIGRPYNQQQVHIIGLLGAHDNQLGAAVRPSCGYLKQEKFASCRRFPVTYVSSARHVHSAHMHMPQLL